MNRHSISIERRAPTTSVRAMLIRRRSITAKNAIVFLPLGLAYGVTAFSVEGHDFGNTQYSNRCMNMLLTLGVSGSKSDWLVLSYIIYKNAFIEISVDFYLYTCTDKIVQRTIPHKSTFAFSIIVKREIQNEALSHPTVPALDATGDCVYLSRICKSSLSLETYRSEHIRNINVFTPCIHTGG